MEAMTEQSKDSTKVQLGVPMSFIGDIYREHGPFTYSSITQKPIPVWMTAHLTEAVSLESLHNLQTAQKVGESPFSISAGQSAPPTPATTKLFTHSIMDFFCRREGSRESCALHLSGTSKICLLRESQEPLPSFSEEVLQFRGNPYTYSRHLWGKGRMVGWNSLFHRRKQEKYGSMI